eukprot:TRINITY_DN2673_c0_g1_i3.p1 TRINITY_DN2673_c0_g1~~TRINITY_DN2673_c0_g1_i3.p1  ORF type:complete len:215 (+),score=28.57 TRINITY_DN2673_c0_g1_i3:74-718(+)
MLQARLGRELSQLEREPPPGVSAWAVDSNITHLEARLQGPENTPYEKGSFKLELLIPDRYPLEPPKVKFITKIYHPNIDSGGRICLDTLCMPPKGVWRPSLNISTVLTSLLLLMSHPNPDDPLMVDINDEYKHNKQRFIETARHWTKTYAMSDDTITSTTTTMTTTSSTTTTSDPIAPTTATSISTSTESKNKRSADEGDLYVCVLTYFWWYLR